MANFHPELDLLIEYAAGTLPLAPSTCISVHLNYCEKCRHSSANLQSLGGALFEELDSTPVGDSLLDAVLAKLDSEPPLSYARANTGSANRTPELLQRLMSGDLRDLIWKKITSTLKISYLKTGDPNYEFALYHIKAGSKIPEHTHRGSEITLVLEGGFSDANGSYHQGDFLLRKAGEVHAPAAVQSEDCICLGVLDAPLKFTAWQYRWMNPFMRLHGG